MKNLNCVYLLAATAALVSVHAKTIITPDHGFHDAPFEVQISTTEAGAEIRYTTDGSEPAKDQGLVYHAPITITNTTVLRAGIVVSSGKTKQLHTCTYLFPRLVARQTGVNFPKSWGTKEGWQIPADYEMDHQITESAAYRDDLIPALRSLPAVSLVMKLPDWFDPKQGLYANPEQHGSDWERACSVEFIPAEGSGGFQADCGLRIQGGWNRRPEESPKHSLRLIFKKKYGKGELHFPLFGADGVKKFDGLILRGGCNNTWLHWSGEERRRGDYIRDQWLRETHASLGRPAARGVFVHLYLNGLYWGIYNLTERPDENFAARLLGGKPADYDARNSDNILSGDELAWKKMFDLANGGLADQNAFQRMQELLDVPAFIDYMLVNLHGANMDWDRASNWYAARRREPGGKFLFLIWDGERTSEDVTANILDKDDDLCPTRLFQKLRENAEFRRMFAERAKALLTGNGALTPENCGKRFQRLATLLDPAIVAESARWGDYRRDVHPYKTGPYELYTRNDHWRPEIRRLLSDYFPRRTEALIHQLQEAGLFPAEAH